MKLSLRTFLVLALLLGAFGVPWGWQAYQAWRAEEIQRLQRELAELRDRQIERVFQDVAAALSSSSQPSDNQLVSSQAAQIEERIADVEDRLMRLTGVPTTRAEPMRLKTADMDGDGGLDVIIPASDKLDASQGVRY